MILDSVSSLGISLFRRSTAATSSTGLSKARTIQRTTCRILDQWRPHWLLWLAGLVGRAWAVLCQQTRKAEPESIRLEQGGLHLCMLSNPLVWDFRSPSHTKADFTTGDAKAASDNYVLIREFLKRFPNVQGNDFYIASESYGGHYMPQCKCVCARLVIPSLPFVVSQPTVGNGNFDSKYGWGSSIFAAL
jgi:hypothetical protein